MKKEENRKRKGLKFKKIKKEDSRLSELYSRFFHVYLPLLLF